MRRQATAGLAGRQRERSYDLSPPAPIGAQPACAVPVVARATQAESICVTSNGSARHVGVASSMARRSCAQRRDEVCAADAGAVRSVPVSKVRSVRTSRATLVDIACGRRNSPEVRHVA